MSKIAGAQKRDTQPLDQSRDGVVMLPVEQFRQPVRRPRKPKSLVQFFGESPLVGLKLDMERDRDTGVALLNPWRA